MGRRVLSSALSAMVNAERRAKATVQLQPIPAVVYSFLGIMKDRGNSKPSHSVLIRRFLFHVLRRSVRWLECSLISDQHFTVAVNCQLILL